MTERRPLILAYVVLCFGIVALVGLVLRNDDIFVVGAGFAPLVAMLHGISFFLRVRRRWQPALLDTRGRAILGITLGSVVAIVLVHFVVMLTLAQKVETSIGFFWLTLLAIVAYRAWTLQSARRAGIMQILAVVIGLPQMLVNIATADRGTLTDSIETALLLAFIVISASGPVLDKLYSSVSDREQTAVPEARALR